MVLSQILEVLQWIVNSFIFSQKLCKIVCFVRNRFQQNEEKTHGDVLHSGMPVADRRSYVPERLQIGSPATLVEQNGLGEAAEKQNHPEKYAQL